MKAVTKFLAVGVAIAALAIAAPAAAQYYPGYGSPYGGYGYGAPSVIGSIINGVTGGYGYNNGYGYNVRGGSQVAVNQCSAAVQQRIGYGGYGYGAGYGGGVSVNSVEIRNGGGYKVRGIANAAGYGAGAVGFSCRTDPRGLVVDVDLNNGYRGYNNGYTGYYGSNYNDPYAAYGYRRY